MCEQLEEEKDEVSDSKKIRRKTVETNIEWFPLVGSSIICQKDPIEGGRNLSECRLPLA